MIASATVPETHRQAYCRNCDKQVTTVVRKPNHLAHFLVTFLGGLIWGIVWIVVALRGETYRCSRCGAKTGRGRPTSEVFE